MPRPASGKRERLAEAAAELVRTRGLDGATIAVIAERAKVPPGSVFYYLPSKEAIADAAVDAVAAARAQGIEQWSAAPSPQERLTAYLDAAATNAKDVAASGNAGTLAASLRASAPDAAARAAKIVTDTVEWAAEQFVEVGFSAQAANARALHLVTGIEGAGQLAHALADPTPLEREAAHLSRWVANSRSNA
ncbi:TetR/AcrR family transcriptional regulator [Demequina sp.]|uniref:TetR/AcrR family transcriptional regulator n=1 Tax=Demequina sp. TaxID=2050685 RepID=UPI003D0D3DBE